MGGYWEIRVGVRGVRGKKRRSRGSGFKELGGGRVEVEIMERGVRNSV